MSNEWLDKAKKLAETAKNANYGEILNKTKNMAMQAADEAKKAADSVMSKNNLEDSDDVEAENTESVAKTTDVAVKAEDKSKLLKTCNARLANIEILLQDVKDLLQKS